MFSIWQKALNKKQKSEQQKTCHCFCLTAALVEDILYQDSSFGLEALEIKKKGGGRYVMQVYGNGTSRLRGSQCLNPRARR